MFTDRNIDERPGIVIVDDEFLITEQLKSILEGHGATCLAICHDAEQAIDVIGRLKPDIVFMDVRLPGDLDGIDAAEVIRDRYDIHVIFITGEYSKTILDRISFSEPFGLIIKPFDEAQICSTLIVGWNLVKMKQKLREKDTILKIALEAAKIEIWRLDSEHNLTYWDQGFNRIIGRIPEETTQSGSLFLKYVHPDDREYLRSEVRSALENQYPLECEFRLIDEHNNLKYVLLRGTINSRGDGMPTGTMIDISEFRSLEERLTVIRENQRQEIGELLHDDIGQQLVAMMMRADTLADELMTKGENGLSERVSAMRENMHSILDNIRLVSRNMYPVSMSPGGLGDALCAMASDVTALSGISCVCIVPEDIMLPDQYRSTQIFYIISEAVNNAVKHSHADKIKIELKLEDGDFCAIVSDNGKGFSKESKPHGIGMTIMRFRTRRIKGLLDISSSEKGTDIIIKLKGNGADNE